MRPSGATAVASNGATVESANGRTGAVPRGEIELRGVSFSYPGGRGAALRDVDVRIPAGATVALVGRAGAGKTMLISKLFEGLPPDRPRLRLSALGSQGSLAQRFFELRHPLRVTRGVHGNPQLMTEHAGEHGFGRGSQMLRELG